MGGPERTDPPPIDPRVKKKATPPKRRRFTRTTMLLLVLLVAFAVLGLVLDGLASTLAWILFLLVIVALVGGAAAFPQTEASWSPYGRYHKK